MEMKSISEELKAVSGEIYYVPEDLIFDILLRLPVKSLLKLRCVSKSWWYLISSKRFVQSQLEFATNNPDDYLRIAICTSSKFLAYFNQYNLNDFMHNLHCSELLPAEFYFPRHDRKSKLTCQIIGTCNGLICALMKTQLFVWNPSTRTHRKLFYRDGAAEIHWLRIGFCFHGGDYKVFASYRELGSDKIIAKLFSLTTDSWRRIGNTIPELSGDPTAGKFVNGKVYWYNSRDYRKVGIVYFDLGSEACGTVESPPVYNPLDFVVFQKCLCLISGDVAITDVWVLKHDQSWNKIVSIADKSCPGKYEYGAVRPVWMTQEGEILISYGKEMQMQHCTDTPCTTGFVIYDPRSKSFRQSNAELPGLLWLFSDSYITSLVSPLRDD